MINNYEWLGKWYIRAIDTDTREVVHEQEVKNTIMNGALDELYKPLYGDTPDLEIKYLALGTSSVSVATTQTVLDSEEFRTLYTTRNTNSNQEAIHTFVVFDNEAQVQIEEIGVFGGSAASATTDSGILISRILWSYDKTPTNIELQFQRTDKVQRA